MQNKILHIEIESCNTCPYQRYDPDYGTCYDSGYDCSLTGKRLVNDGELKTYKKKKKEYLESSNTFFPIPEPIDIVSNIPEWCPIPNKESETE